MIPLRKSQNKKKKTKLLIVDDSNNNREAINYWLGEENYELLHASNGISALKICETFIPDIILLDYNLPDIDGIEVCQKIRANKSLPFIPIIMMSSYAPEATVIALEQGADDFIIMPMQPAELKSRIKATLRLKEAIYESVELSKENKKLQELDKIKSNFISKVSHELKTPLQAILGYTDILSGGLQGELNHPQKLMTKQIHDAGEQLLNLINQLLDFDNTEKKEKFPSHEVLTIEEIFNYLSQVATPVAMKKSIDLNFILEDKNIQLETDRNMLNKILLNIISNSIKFSNENSKVMISAKDHQELFIEFKIQDEGIGISKSNISYIFDKFWQVDDSITRAYGGLGIGLALAKKLVAILDGEIFVESKPNKGSVFRVLIPKELKSVSSFSANSMKNAV